MPVLLSCFLAVSTLLAVEKGMRVAQLVLERIITPPVEVVEDLDATDRGTGGFGSTGFVGNPSS